MGLAKYFNFKIDMNLKKYQISDEYIGVNWEDDFDLYLKKKKELRLISNKMEKKYFIDHLKKMEYVKMKKNEEL